MPKCQNHLCHCSTLKDQVLVDLPGNRLSLRGDVLLKCYEPCSSTSSKENGRSLTGEKRLLFQCQFNTCALGLDALAQPPKVALPKEELDFVCHGSPI